MHLDVNSPLEIMQVVEESQEQPTETDIASQEGYIWVPKGLDSSQVRVFFSVIVSKNRLFFVLDEIHTVLTQRIRLYSKMFSCIQMIYLINASNSRISFFSLKYGFISPHLLVIANAHLEWKTRKTKFSLFWCCDMWYSILSYYGVSVFV